MGKSVWLLAALLCGQLAATLAARPQHPHRHVIRSTFERQAAAGGEADAAVSEALAKESSNMFGDDDVKAFAEAISRKLQQDGDEYPYKKEDWLRLAQMVFEEAEDRLTAPHYVKEVAARVRGAAAQLHGVGSRRPGSGRPAATATEFGRRSISKPELAPPLPWPVAPAGRPEDR